MGLYLDKACTKEADLKQLVREERSGVTVYAKYDDSKITIIFDANTGRFDDGSEKKTIIKDLGTDISVEEPSKHNYKFDDWYSDPVNGTKVDINSLTSNTTVYAHYDKIAFVITFDANGGKFEDGEEIKEVVINPNDYDEKDFEKPTKEQKNFINWYTDRTDGDVVDFSKIVEDIIVYAQWGNMFEISSLSIEYEGTTNIEPTESNFFVILDTSEYGTLVCYTDKTSGYTVSVLDNSNAVKQLDSKLEQAIINNLEKDFKSETSISSGKTDYTFSCSYEDKQADLTITR